MQVIKPIDGIIRPTISSLVPTVAGRPAPVSYTHLDVYKRQVLLLSHGIAKVDDFAALSEVFPDPLGLGSRISLTLAIFGELFCSVGFIVGAFYRLALIPMIFTMCVALFVVHGNDPFAVKELAAIYLSVFVLMYISGPGNYALDRLIAERLRN